NVIEESDEDNTLTLNATPITVIDTTPPTSNSFSINSGASHTNTMGVTLTLASTGASQMRFKNESGGTWTSYEPYTTSKSWTLDSTEGTRTVYVQFKDAAGNEAAEVSERNILDNFTHENTANSIAGGETHATSTSVTL
ncbi:MAG: hypothetical protein VX385_05610, partial [Acidobacteriota bacterium]|nr:hypothetical protein [Acidobacteriota bacterium]